MGKQPEKSCNMSSNQELCSKAARTLHCRSQRVSFGPAGEARREVLALRQHRDASERALSETRHRIQQLESEVTETRAQLEAATDALARCTLLLLVLSWGSVGLFAKTELQQIVGAESAPCWLSNTYRQQSHACASTDWCNSRLPIHHFFLTNYYHHIRTAKLACNAS